MHTFKGKSARFHYNSDMSLQDGFDAHVAALEAFADVEIVSGWLPGGGTWSKASQ